MKEDVVVGWAEGGLFFVYYVFMRIILRSLLGKERRNRIIKML